VNLTPIRRQSGSSLIGGLSDGLSVRAVRSCPYGPVGSPKGCRNPLSCSIITMITMMDVMVVAAGPPQRRVLFLPRAGQRRRTSAEVRATPTVFRRRALVAGCPARASRRALGCLPSANSICCCQSWGCPTSRDRRAGNDDVGERKPGSQWTPRWRGFEPSVPRED
jgi:hypothetical protein